MTKREARPSHKDVCNRHAEAPVGRHRSPRTYSISCIPFNVNRIYDVVNMDVLLIIESK